MSSSKGKTTCKEVNSTCKCTIIEKPMSGKSKSKRNDCKDECKEEKKKDCVATIVGVLSLPENFCCDNNKKDECDTKDECDDSCGEQKDECGEKKDECVEVYRDLGECLQKCIIKTSKKQSDC